MNHFPTYALRHAMSLRVPLSLFDWIREKSEAEGLPPATYTVKRLEELAQLDLLKAEVQDDPDAA